MRIKPTLLTVDDEPDVLRAVERDLRRHYGRDYRILRAESGASALDTLRQLQQRDEEPALLLADQRMPHMSGVEFLAEARQLFPDAKRVLLTAYADTAPRSTPSIRSAPTTISSNRGIRPRSTSIRSSTICLKTGAAATGPSTKGCACSATAGLLKATN